MWLAYSTCIFTELKDASLHLVDMYCKKLSFSKDLDPQENVHGEEFLSMASNALVQVSYCVTKFDLLVHCLISVADPSNFFMDFSLVKCRLLATKNMDSHQMISWIMKYEHALYPPVGLLFDVLCLNYEISPRKGEN